MDKNPYEPPKSNDKSADLSAKPPRTYLWPAISALGQGLLLSIEFGLLLGFVPSYEHMYKDFRADIPLITVLVIDASHFADSFRFFVPVLILLWIAAVFFVLSRRRDAKRQVIDRAWQILMPMVILALIALTIFAAAWPMTSLIGDLRR